MIVSKWMRVFLATGMVVGTASHGVSSAQETTPDRRRVVAQRPLQVVPSDATLAERMGDVDAVVVLRVLGPGEGRTMDVGADLRRLNPGSSSGEFLSVVTVYDSRIKAVLKPHLRAGAVNAQLRVAQYGGEGTSGDERRLVVERRSTPFANGATYMVFLRYNEAFDLMMVDDFDSFHLIDDEVEATDAARSTAYGRSLIGMSSDEAIAATREAIDAAERTPAQ